MDKNSHSASETQRKQRYEKLFEMLLETIPCSVLLIDRDMRIMEANKNFREKNRKERVRTIGHRLEELLPETILENMDIVSRVRQVFENKQATRGERMIYRAPGVPMRIYYYSILPFSWRGYVENALLLMEDVTEQVRLNDEVRRAERHLASVVESATDIVVSTDSEGLIVTWNLAAERLSGYSLEEVGQTALLDRFASEHQTELSHIFKILKVKATPQTGEWHIVTKAGTRIPVSWVLSPMTIENTRLSGIVAVGRDLSERRKLEAQLLRSQKLAALGVMAGGIAHEIRNPLAICLAAAQFLDDDDIGRELRKECVDKIQTNIHRASVIIENLLKFARPAPTRDMTEVDLSGILRDTVALVANQAKLQKVSVVLESPARQVTIHGNADLLQQVFLNLFLNAINAMPDGGMLRVCTESTAWEVAVRITDSGLGIPTEHLENIFDPFYTLSPVGKGTGLGLSICYSVVKQHLGNIEVLSSEGGGTVFTVTLPLFLSNEETIHGKPGTAVHDRR